MRVQPVEHGALQALNSVLQSIESVRNARALYLLLLAFAGASLLMTLAQGALAREAGLAAALWLAAAFFSLFYASNAAGLVLMDEACGREPRLPGDALRDALRIAHRLLAVVLCVLLAKVFMAAFPELLHNQYKQPLEGTKWQSAMTYKFVGAIKGA